MHGRWRFSLTRTLSRPTSPGGRGLWLSRRGRLDHEVHCREVLVVAAGLAALDAHEVRAGHVNLERGALAHLAAGLEVELDGRLLHDVAGQVGGLFLTWL